MTSDMQNDSIHVALAVYDPRGTYSRYAGVVMTSIFENTKSRVTVHLLHDNTLTEDNRRKFLRTAEKYGQCIKFLDMTPHVAQLGEELVEIVRKTWSIGTLYRLLIPDFLPLSRVIYLDCDVLVNLDIQELWDIDMEGKCLAGVADCTKRFSANSFRIHLLGGSHSSYVNAGVLLMDLERIRERDNFLEVCPAWFKEHHRLANLADQDFLNVFFQDSIRLIPGRFNEMRDGHAGENSILHLILDHKPWARMAGYAADRLYWKMYLRSAWGEGMDREAIVDILSETARHTPKLHMHTSQCWRQVGLRLWKDIVLNEVTRCLIIVVLCLVGRLGKRVRS